MTKERVAGFLLGISAGTALGFFLRKGEEAKPELENAGAQRESGPKAPGKWTRIAALRRTHEDEMRLKSLAL